VLYSARFAAGTSNALYTESGEQEGERTLNPKLDGANTATPVSQGTILAVSCNGNLLMRSSGFGDTVAAISAVWADGKPLNVKLGNVVNGDWMPNGRQLAVIRRVGADEQLEFPAGHVVYRSSGWLTNLRVSPDGTLTAFIEHPVRDDDRGHVEVVDAKGVAHQLGDEWSSATGLAWSKTGREVYFTASHSGVVRSLYAVSISGALRRLSNEPTSLRLFDVGSDGRLLVAVDEVRLAMLAHFRGDAQPADVSKFDAPSVQAISNDGQRILFTESGDAGGRHC
jgi:eukaryotic-like serine/threonine-protein kinase